MTVPEAWFVNHRHPLKTPKGQSLSSHPLKEQGLGSDTLCPICVTPAPLTFPPQCWISAYFDIRKGCQCSHVSTWISVVNYRTELFCRQYSCFVHARGSHQMARQHLLISSLQLHIAFVPYRRKAGEGGWGNIGRSWKVLWWISAGNKKLN